MKETRDEIVAKLEERHQRLHEIETLGAKALSVYDLTIAYGGDHDMAVRESTRLVKNHIISYTRQLTEIDKIPQQRKLL